MLLLQTKGGTAAVAVEAAGSCLLQTTDMTAAVAVQAAVQAEKALRRMGASNCRRMPDHF